MRLVRHTAGALAVAFVLVAATACGTEPQASGPSPAPSSAPAASGSPSASPPPGDGAGKSDDATVVTVTLADREIALSQVALTAGAHRFVIEQNGQEPHAFAISGPGVSEEIGQIEPGGGPEELTVALETGNYRLWCPVTGHAEAGMDVTIEVE